MAAWVLVLRTDTGEEYTAVNDMLSFNLTKKSDRIELVEAVEEVFCQALLDAVGQGPKGAV